MRHAHALEQMKSSLVPGKVYRRANFTEMSSNVDRNLAKMLEEGCLERLLKGLYLAPKKTAFGNSLPDENSLLEHFLNDDHFVVFSPSQFNSLGLGTTQLYNVNIVFNRKRVGEFTLGGRSYRFHRWREAPTKLTKEFLLVQLLNRINHLAEDKNEVLKNLRFKLHTFDLELLKFNSEHYGTVSAQKILKELLKETRH